MITESETQEIMRKVASKCRKKWPLISQSEVMHMCITAREKLRVCQTESNLHELRLLWKSCWFSAATYCQRETGKRLKYARLDIDRWGDTTADESAEADVTKGVEREWLHTWLSELVGRLTPRQSETVWRHMIVGERLVDIAESQRVSKSGATKSLCKALRNLRRMVGEVEG